MKRSLTLLCTTLAAMVLTPRSAQAVTCSFISVTGVTFGTYDVFDATPLDSTGNITYRCTSVGGSDMISIDISTGIAGTYYPRTLTAAAKELDYNVFTDASRSTIWGDATGSTSHYGPLIPPEATDVDIPIYGRVPAQQDPYAASFADTIVVTINY